MSLKKQPTLKLTYVYIYAHDYLIYIKTKLNMEFIFPDAFFLLERNQIRQN